MGYWVTEGDFHCVMCLQHTSNIMCCSQLDFIPAIRSGRTFSTKKTPQFLLHWSPTHPHLGCVSLFFTSPHGIFPVFMLFQHGTLYDCVRGAHRNSFPWRLSAWPIEGPRESTPIRIMFADGVWSQVEILLHLYDSSNMLKVYHMLWERGEL